MSLVADALRRHRLARPLRPSAAPAHSPLAIESSPATDWDAAIAGFDEVCQEQLYVFRQAAGRRSSTSRCCSAWTARVVGGSLMMIQRLPLGVGSIAIAKWGPMLRQGATGRTAATLYTRHDRRAGRRVCRQARG